MALNFYTIYSCSCFELLFNICWVVQDVGTKAALSRNLAGPASTKRSGSSFTPAPGVTLNAKNNIFATSAQNQTFRIGKTGANLWLLAQA
jgi:hypothetical protein